MHDLPFKMHWKKMRANIHMPRSVQYPGLCFFFFSPCTLSSVIPSSYFFNKSIAMEGRGACRSLLLAALFLLIHAVKRKENRGGGWGGEGSSSFSLCWLSPRAARNTVWSTTVRLPSARTAHTAAHRASEQPSPRFRALSCLEHERSRLDALRSSWAVLPLLSQRLETHRTKCLRSHPTPRSDNFERKGVGGRGGKGGKKANEWKKKNKNLKSDWRKKREALD